MYVGESPILVFSLYLHQEFFCAHAVSCIVCSIYLSGSKDKLNIGNYQSVDFLNIVNYIMPDQ